MKNLLTICTLLFLSCAKEDIQPQPEVCDFGNYSLTKREFNPDAKSMIKRFSGLIDLSKTRNVILLDFDGHTVSGTSWNYNGDFICSGSGLTGSEMITIIDNIRTYFEPFNVVVTTDERLLAIADNKIRLVLTESWEWYKTKVGGVAYTHSFKWNDGTPCFVFTSLLGYHIGNISQASAHEIGHTLGLRHQAEWIDCNLKTSYRKGVLMGLPYGYNANWTTGQTPYKCDSYQDDKLIIKQTLN